MERLRIEAINRDRYRQLDTVVASSRHSQVHCQRDLRRDLVIRPCLGSGFRISFAGTQEDGWVDKRIQTAIVRTGYWWSQSGSNRRPLHAIEALSQLSYGPTRSRGKLRTPLNIVKPDGTRRPPKTDRVSGRALSSRWRRSHAAARGITGYPPQGSPSAQDTGAIGRLGLKRCGTAEVRLGQLSLSGVRRGVHSAWHGLG